MLPSTDFRPHLGRARMASIALAATAGTGLLVLVIASWEGPIALRALNWGAAGIVACLISVLVLKRLLHWFSRHELFSPFIAFPVTYMLWFALGSLTLWNERNVKVLQYSSIGLACYFAGVVLDGWRADLRPLKTAFRNEWENSRLWLFVVSLAAATVLFFITVNSRIVKFVLDYVAT